MTLIVPDNGLADPSTTGSELHDFQRNLDVTRQNVDDLGGRVETVKEAVEFTKSALEQVEEIHKQADSFLSTIKGMQFTLKVTGKVGPLKLPSETLGKVLDKLETLATHVTYRAGQLAKKIEDGDYVDKLQSAEDKLSSLEDALETTEGQLGDYETGVFNTRFALGVGGTALDPLEASLNSAATPVNDVLVPLNTAYMSVTEKLDDLTGIFSAPSSPSLSVFEPLTTLAGQFGAINGSLEFLKGPLGAVHSALKPVEWALDAVQVVYDVTVGPVIDWILDKLGVTAIMDRIADAITDALPIDLDGVLDEVTGQVDAVFDQIEGFIGTVSVPGWDTEIDDIITDITDDVVNVFDAASSTELRFGEDGNDTLLGRDGSTDVLIGLGGNDEVRGAPTGGTASDSFDIFIASEGNDTLHGGGSSNDWLILPGLLDDWVVSRFSSTAPFVFYHKDGKWGYEVAYDIENFAFYDGSYTASTLEALGIITSGITNGNDNVAGGTDDDLIAPLDGSDTVDGGDGVDTYLIPVDQQSGGVIDIRLDSARTDGAGITYQGYAFSSNDVDYLNNFENAISQRNVATELFGTDGDNLLISDNGADYLVGKGGDDQLLGHGGKDFLRGDAGSDSVFGGAENDTLLGGPALAGETNFYDGGSGADRLVYSTDVSDYDLNPPFDTIVQGSLPASGPLRIFAETGTIQHMSMDLSTVIATDTARNIETYVGSDTDDTLRGAQSDGEHLMTIDGGDGDDLMFSDGADWVKGGSGSDTIHATGSGTSVDGGTSSSDQDVLDLRAIQNARWLVNNGFGATFQLKAIEGYEVETLTDSSGGSTGAQVTQLFNGSMTGIEELLLGDGNDDFYHNGTGDVTVRSFGGDDYLKAAHGNGSQLEITFFAGEGNDTIEYANAFGEAHGEAGDDEFFIDVRGNGYVFDGGEGDDFFEVENLYSSGLTSEIIGGDGYDRVSFQQDTRFFWVSYISLNLSTGTFTSVATSNGTILYQGKISGVEEVIGDTQAQFYVDGSAEGDRLIGLDPNDNLDGRLGNDELFGGGGNDVLNGGADNDILHGGLGNDTLDGDGNTDTASYSNARPGTTRGDLISGNFGGVHVDLTAGYAEGAFGDDVLSNIENVIGSMGDDILIGDDGENVLTGGEGDDTLLGMDDDDILTPGDGNDVMFGGAGRDRFFAGPGNSSIFGGTGTDILDLSAVSGDQVVSMSSPDFQVSLTRAEPVWADTGTEEGRIFNGVTMSPRDVLEASVENANSDDDLTRQLPDTDDYAADPNLPSFEIAFEDRLVQNTIQTVGVEGVATGRGDDKLTGNATNNRLEGGAGNDTLEGGDGFDSLYGDGGDDLIHASNIAGAGSSGAISADVDLIDLNDTALTGRLQTGPLTSMPTTALTIEMLIRREMIDAAESPFSYAVQNSTNELTIFTETFVSNGVRPKMTIIINGTSVSTTVPADALYDGELHRLSFTVDSATGTLAMFIDGLKVWSESGVTAAQTPISTGGILILGQDQDGSTPGGGFQSSQAFEGQVGDLRIFDTVVSDALIKARAFQTDFADPAAVPDLVEYWAADATTGTFGSAISADMTEHGALSYITETPPTSSAYYEQLFGGSGNDTLIGAQNGTTMSGDEGDDLLIGSSAGDTLSDGYGENTIQGMGGSDFLYFGGSSDVGVWGAGDDDDYVYGFDVGTDRVDINAMGMTQAQIDALAAAATTNGAGTDTTIDFGNGTIVFFSGVTKTELQQVLANEAPELTIADQVVRTEGWVRLTDVMSVYDKNLNPLAEVQLWDDEGGMNWWADGGFVDATTGYRTTNAAGVWFQADAVAGNQTLWVRGHDGEAWGGWDDFSLKSNAAPVVAIQDQKLATDGKVRLSDVMGVTDDNGDVLAEVELWDNEGAMNWEVDGTLVDASTGYVVADPTTVWMVADAAPGTQTLWVRGSDGDDQGPWADFELATNAPPEADVSDQVIRLDGARSLGSVLGIIDADGDAAVSVELWDDAGGMNWWADGGLVDASSGYVTSDLASVSIRGDSTPGTQTLWVRLYDGLDWGGWESFALTSQVNSAPTVTIEDQQSLLNDWLRLSDMMNVSDADGDPVTTVQLWDDQGGNSWWVDGSFVDATSGHVTGSVENVWLRADAASSVQKLWVRANDGEAWSGWDAFDLTSRTNTAPTATIEDQAVVPDQWRKLSDVLSFADADGDTIEQLELWDSDGGMNWWVDGAFVDASSGHVVSGTSNVWMQGDATPGNQTLYLRAFDGLAWSAWDQFDLETRDNAAPTVTVPDQSLNTSQWLRLSDVLSFSDPDGDALQKLAIWDDVGVDSWWADGGYVDATTGYETSDPDSVWVRGDAAAGVQTLYVRGSDGLEWGAWDAFDLTTV